MNRPIGPQPSTATERPARSCSLVAKTALPNGSCSVAISGGSFVRSFCQITDSGHGDVARERALAVDAEDARALAHVRLAGAALEAHAAGDVALGRDVVADLDVVDVVSDLDDRAGELVAERERRVDALLRPLVPLLDVQVGAADRRGLDLDDDLARAGDGIGDLVELEPGPGSTFRSASMTGASLVRGASTLQHCVARTARRQLRPRRRLPMRRPPGSSGW